MAADVGGPAQNRWIWFEAVMTWARADRSAERPSLTHISAVVLHRARAADADCTSSFQSQSTVAKLAGMKRDSVRAVDEWLVERGLLAEVARRPGNVAEYDLTVPVDPDQGQPLTPLGVNGAATGGPSTGSTDQPLDPLVDPQLGPLEGHDHQPGTRQVAAAAEQAAAAHLDEQIRSKRGTEYEIQNPGGYRSKHLPVLIAIVERELADDRDPLPAMSAEYPIRHSDHPLTAVAGRPGDVEPAPWTTPVRPLKDLPVGSTDRGAPLVDFEGLR